MHNRIVNLSGGSGRFSKSFYLFKNDHRSRERLYCGETLKQEKKVVKRKQAQRLLGAFLGQVVKDTGVRKCADPRDIQGEFGPCATDKTLPGRT